MNQYWCRYSASMSGHPNFNTWRCFCSIFSFIPTHIIWSKWLFFMTWSCLCQPRSWILMIYEIGVMPYIQSAVLLDRLKERDFHRSFYHHSLIGCNFHSPHSVCNCMAVTIWTQDDIKCWCCCLWFMIISGAHWSYNKMLDYILTFDSYENENLTATAEWLELVQIS